jgi:hypothetical protein
MTWNIHETPLDGGDDRISKIVASPECAETLISGHFRACQDLQVCLGSAETNRTSVVAHRGLISAVSAQDSAFSTQHLVITVCEAHSTQLQHISIDLNYSELL